MKSKYPERYEPGELSETRKRLGDLSEAEAKKYADMLGGEIGVEKGRAPQTAFGTTDKDHADTAGTGQSEAEASPRFLSSMIKKRKVPYLHRVKIDFLCASTEYRLKTKGNAFLSLFRGIFPSRDFINPFFLSNAEDLFYMNLDNLVTAVRALAAIAKYTNAYTKIPGYDWEIITAVAAWNIEGIHLDIVRFKLQPKRRHVKLLRTLARNIYYPMMRLAVLNDPNDILKALLRVYRELIKIGSISGKRERLDTYYNVAKAELPVVFGRIKIGLYPLLLKMYETDFYTCDEVFTSRLEEFAVLLMIREEQLIKKEAFLETPSPDMPEEETEETEETDEAPVEEVPIFLLSPLYGDSELFRSGNKLLEALFPRCGWNNPDELSDFYAYFRSLLPFPKGSGILAPENPIPRILTLTLIIQELLLGFRDIDFGVIRDEEENPLGLSLSFGEIAADWYRYGEEIIGKQYIPLLQEYCRNVEQDMRFRGSPYGRRLLSESNWLLKHYFLPFLAFDSETGTRPPTESTVDPLSATLSRFSPILEAVVADNLDDDVDVSDSVKNPHRPFYFEVENVCSRRLRLVLEREQIPADNVSLLAAVYLLVKHLDEIISNPLSVGYSEGETVPYRREKKETLSPVYIVEERDTLSLLAEDEKADPSVSGQS